MIASAVTGAFSLTVTTLSWTGGIVTFAVLWFICLLVILPRGLRTQLEAGEVEPGTPGGAPTDLRFGRKLLWTTAVAALIWAVVWIVIESGVVSLSDFEFLMPASFREPPTR